MTVTYEVTPVYTDTAKCIGPRGVTVYIWEVLYKSVKKVDGRIVRKHISDSKEDAEERIRLYKKYECDI